MKGWRVGVWIVTFVALVTVFGPYLADWNETHIYNPRWAASRKMWSGAEVKNKQRDGRR
jgi:hypothetical protein